jgi:hypothetical protein
MLPKRVDPSLWAVPDHHLRHGGLGLVADQLSRRGFLGRAAGAAGAVVGASVLRSGTALAAKAPTATPRPIPGGITVNGVTFHVLPFGPGQEPSTITDFNGFVGVADVRGTGTGTKRDGTTETLLYDTDMRFMKGVFVGKDGRVHKGTFGFV